MSLMRNITRTCCHIIEAPLDREDESTLMDLSLIAPNIVPVPSIVDPSVVAPSIAASSLALEQPQVLPVKKTGVSYGNKRLKDDVV
jgi:hypothetical protein